MPKMKQEKTAENGLERRKVQFPLSRKMAILVLAVAATLSTVLISLTYFHYRQEMYEHYEKFAMNVAGIAASQLNPDKIQTYLDTGVKDEEYEKAFKILCDIREKGGVKYLYVVKPEVDEVYYVLDTDPSDEAIPLGYHEKYYQGAFADNAEKMAHGDRIEPLISNEEFGWLMSVYYPLWTSAGDPAGYVGVDIQMTEVQQDLHGFARSMIVLALFLTAIISLVLIQITYYAVTRPIGRLSAAVEQLVESEQTGGNKGTSIFKDITIQARDEVGALCDSLTQMEQDMNGYIRDLVTVTADKERIGAELNVATQIQADMLPSTFPAFPDRKDFDIYATMTPAKEVGGDFYDFFLIDDDHLALVMADVSGKGVPAALFMVIAKTMIKNRALMGGSPAEILYSVNNMLCDGNEAGLFVTVWLAIIELSTGKGIATNAGHEHPVIRRKNGEFELVLYKHSPAVAVMENMKFKEHSFELHSGDTLFVYTDGVPEATNAKNELFGAQRMLGALNRIPDAPPRELLHEVRSSLDEFVNGAPRFDDLTMLALYYQGTEKTGQFEFTVDADIKRLDEVLEFIEGHLNGINCIPKEKLLVNISAEEIFVNIAHYAYPEGKGKATVRVETDQESGSVAVTFMDSGIPYNPLEKKDPDVTLPAEKREVGGLGIFMAKKSMDHIEYEYKDGMNVLRMTKQVAR